MQQLRAAVGYEDRYKLLRHDRDSVFASQLNQSIRVLGIRVLKSSQRRPEAAGKLQKIGVIRYARGSITVLDRPGLEELCCECYAVVKNECDRLLPFSSNAPLPAIGCEGRPVGSFFGSPPLKPRLPAPSPFKEHRLLQRSVQL